MLKEKYHLECLPQFRNVQCRLIFRLPKRFFEIPFEIDDVLDKYRPTKQFTR
jgi:hypothetical protein